MNYFSMFSGVGGFDLALNRQSHKCVGYSEIDKYAIKIYEKNFGNEVKNYGDATKINPNKLPDFDLLCGGFPCQSFSIAGKRKGFEDTRGTMFFEVARILKFKRPKIVLLENVKGLLNHNKGETYKVIIQTLSELGYDVQWMVLNSKFFGVPQNRERVFIIGSIRGQSRPEVLPFGTSLSKTFKQYSPEVSNTITSRYYKQGNSDSYIKVIGTLNSNGWEKRHELIRRIYGTENAVAPTIPTAQGGGVMTKIAIPVLTPTRVEKRQEGRRFKEDGDESFTLTKTDIHGVAVMDLYNNKEHQDRTPALTEPHHNNLRIRDGLKIRRLTPIECERLQGFPDDWTEGVSDTQRYKTIGNAVTVNVVEKIIKRMRLLI